MRGRICRGLECDLSEYESELNIHRLFLYLYTSAHEGRRNNDYFVLSGGDIDLVLTPPQTCPPPLQPIIPVPPSQIRLNLLPRHPPEAYIEVNVLKLNACSVRVKQWIVGIDHVCCQF